MGATEIETTKVDPPCVVGREGVFDLYVLAIRLLRGKKCRVKKVHKKAVEEGKGGRGEEEGGGGGGAAAVMVTVVSTSAATSAAMAAAAPPPAENVEPAE